MEITVQPASSSMAPRALPSLLEMKTHEEDRINGSECCAGVRHTGDQLRFSCDCAAGTILHRPSARALQPHRHNPYIPFTLFSIPSILLFFNIVIVTCYYTLRLFAFTLAIFIDVVWCISFFFFLNFFHLDRFGLSIFNFLYFSLGIPFCIPATLFGWPVLCRISGKNIRLPL